MRDELVTIFGGSGFVGRHVVRQLAKAGYRLRVAVRQPNLANFLLPMGRVGQIQIVPCDVTAEASIARALEGAHITINLVGTLAPHGRQSFNALHVAAPELIARHAKLKGLTRVVHVSAIGARADAASRYARSKAEGEAAIAREFPDATILRPSIVFGPEDKFFNRFANWTRYLPALPLIGGGRTHFQPVFVGDVAEALFRALEDPGSKGRIYELGGPRVYTFRELMALILRETGRQRLLLPVPFAFASLKAMVLGLLPSPILTLDQVRQLREDNVVTEGGDIRTFASVGLQPTAAEAILPAYLWRFRKTGQFEVPAA